MGARFTDAEIGQLRTLIERNIERRESPQEEMARLRRALERILRLEHGTDPDWMRLMHVVEIARAAINDPGVQ